MNQQSHGVDVRLLIHALAWGGECIGTDQASGKKVFVSGVIPGETVVASLCQQQSRYSRAILKEIIHTSPARTQPACEYYGVCGGCNLQHIELSAQRESKRAMVESMILKQASLAPRDGVRLQGEQLPGYGYRRRTILHLDSRSGDVGFFRAGSRHVVDIRQCIVLTKGLQSLLERLRALAHELAPLVSTVILEDCDTELMACARLREIPEAAIRETQQRIADRLRTCADRVEVQLHGKAVAERGGGALFAQGSFSQINAAANHVLRSLVAGYVSHPSASEFYAGSGNLTFPLAQRGVYVDAIEADARLVELGNRRAREQNLISQLQFHACTSEEFVKFATLRASVVLDPPRSGAKGIVDKFDPAVTREVVYVSCSLPTLVRDLKILASRGYSLLHVDVIDMFPQTHHVETISVLRS